MCTVLSSRESGAETDDGCSLLDMVDTALMCLLPPPPLFQIQIHKGNSCIHMCLDYTMLPGDEEFLVGVKGEHKG